MKLFSIIKQVGIGRFIKAGVDEVYRKVVREKIYGSYAQDYEDLIIERVLPNKNGYYLEIGGYHPVRLSNTYRFYKKGWRGVVVEPNPDTKLLFNKFRPLDKFINKGIGIRSGKLEYFKYEIPALNTFDKLQVEINKKKGYLVEKKLEVEILDINIFLKNNVSNQIDLLSLDVEGWDEKILRRWDWKYKPKVICVETEGQNQQISNLLKTQGYRLFFLNNINSIYVL